VTDSSENHPRHPLRSGLSTVQTAVEETGAVGFVHVGGRFDPTRRYLTRVDGPDRETAVVFLAGDANRVPQAVYCVPSEMCTAVSNFEQTAVGGSEIVCRVVGRTPTTATGQQVCAVLNDRLKHPDDRLLLVPRDIPHDTAVFLQQAGYDLQSTAAVTTVRATKAPAERDCLQRVQTAAAEGMARAESVLAASEADTRGLIADGRPLTDDRLRRQMNSALATASVDPADNTSVVSDATESTGHLPVGEPIQLTVAPRGPHGYHGHLTRTLVVDSEGGWERRAFIAVEAGLQAAERTIETGVAVSTVEAESVAEVGAYGFAVAPEPDKPTRGLATAAVHGVGLSTHELPTVGADRQLHSGSVIAVDAGVTHPTHGSVRLGTVFELTTDGTERLVEYPSSLTPVDRHEWRARSKGNSESSTGHLTRG